MSAENGWCGYCRPRDYGAAYTQLLETRTASHGFTFRCGWQDTGKGPGTVAQTTSRGAGQHFLKRDFSWVAPRPQAAAGLNPDI